MGSKRALVVDDSRSARLVLKRLLREHGIVVDEAVSAEDALEYLLYNKPHAIFMDHMMPGIDGLEAVRIIKSDPDTALIPIMMYTSRDGGEVYLSQARALGAVGVLPKELNSVDRLAVLNSLHLLDDPNSANSTASSPAAEPVMAEAEPLSASREIEALARDAADEVMIRLLKPHLDQQTQKLRASMVSELRTMADQLNNIDLRPAPRRWPSLLGGALLGMLLSLGLYNLLLTDNGAAAGPGAVMDRPTADSPLNRQIRDALAQQRSRTDSEKNALLRALEWSLSRQGQFGFAEVPYDDQKLNELTALIQSLHQGGFQGRVHLTAHTGQFCLVQDERGNLTLAPDTLPAADCEVISSELERLQRTGAQETLAFANFTKRQTVVEGSRIRLVINPPQDNRPQVDYPQIDRFLTAGEWNAIARQNQRIEVRLTP